MVQKPHGMIDIQHVVMKSESSLSLAITKSTISRPILLTVNCSLIKAKFNLN